MCLPSQTVYNKNINFRRYKPAFIPICAGALAAEWRLKCNCICPGCGAKLQARLGTERIRHFAHHRAPECNIHIARQTALHLMAKDIIAREKKVMLPAVSFDLIDTKAYKELPTEIKQAYEHELKSKTIPCRDRPQKVTFDDVILEKRVSTIIPDILARRNGQECMIEIAVTHFSNANKKDTVRDLGISSLEIDLSSFAETTLDEKVLTDILLNDTEHKTWLYNALFIKDADKIETLARDICHHYIDQYAAKQRMLAEQERRAEYNQRKEEEKAKRRERAPELLRTAFLPENYRTQLQADRDDQRFSKIYSQLRITKADQPIPFYIDIPISGEFIFDCDHRIWQSMLFHKFIFNRTIGIDEEPPRVYYKKIESWVQQHQKEFKIRWEYSYKCRVNGNEWHLIHDVINCYLSYMNRLGFIKNYIWGYDGFGTVSASHTIIPPNQEQAQLLKDAIDQADPYDPMIDAFIDERLPTPPAPRAPEPPSLLPP